MKYNPDVHRRRSIRLRGYDYSQPGSYFVTIVTHDRQCLFGDVIDGEMRLSDAGIMIAQAWEWLATRHSHVELDSYIVMPNHLHGIIVITADTRRGDSRIAPVTKPKSLGRLVGAFKTVSAKRFNLAERAPGQPLWQRNYYERIIRDEAELGAAREYIVNNPLKRELDRENPAMINGASVRSEAQHDHHPRSRRRTSRSRLAPRPRPAGGVWVGHRT